MTKGSSIAISVAGIALLLGMQVAVAGPSALPPPYNAWSPEEAAARAFGVLAGQRNVRLNDARLWRRDGRLLLAVVAEAERPNVDESFCDCPRPVRLALMDAADGDLHIVAATLIPNVRDGQTLSLNSALLGKRLVREGVFRLRGTELLLPVVRKWDAGGRPRAELTLYRLVDWLLRPVFRRLILDDPTVGKPELSGMHARIRMGDLDPGGVDGYADIRFVEHYFTRFGGDIVDLDDRRIEIWVFGGDRFSLVQCELTGPMGDGACVQ